MTTGADIVEAARSQIGVRWQHQAALDGVACDCIGLLGIAAKKSGLTDAWYTDATARFKGYGPSPQPWLLLDACGRFFDVAKDSPRLGDVLVMCFEKDPQHFGILSSLDPEYVIHSYASVRRVVEHVVDDVWRGRILGRYRFRGLA